MSLPESRPIMPQPCRVLLVDDSPTQLAQMQALLESSGYEVVTAADGEAAIVAFEASRPRVVVTDLDMPKLNGLELVAAIKRLAPGVPVILTTGTGPDEIAAEALLKGAISYVPKSEMRTGLSATVAQVLAITDEAAVAEEATVCLTQGQLEFRLPNNESLVPGVIARLEAAIRELQLFDEMEWTQIAMALDEAILNGMIHGNLEVSSALREIDDGAAYTEKIQARQHESPYRDRRVLVALTATRTQAVFVVRDEGNGFDLGKVPDPTDPSNLENISGRGLLLINAFMDEVHHNERGNEITMHKRKPTSREPNQADDSGGTDDSGELAT